MEPLKKRTFEDHRKETRNEFAACRYSRSQLSRTVKIWRHLGSSHKSSNRRYVARGNNCHIYLKGSRGKPS